MDFGEPPPDFELPLRPGQRPRTSVGLPHLQLDQWPPQEIANRLVELSLGMPGVRARQSRMAFPSSVALCLDDDFAHGPPDAFIDNHEFCLLHSLPQASVHLTLPPPIREWVVQMGWAEQHPGVRVGILPQTLVMIYAPRDDRELRIVFRIVAASFEFARGSAPARPAHRQFDGVLTWAG